MSDGAQRDQEEGPTLEEAMRETVMAAVKELHTSTPGIVRAFDAATQTATVQPAIRRIWIGEEGQREPRDLPECIHVPVVFVGGGPYVLTFPVAAGDECELRFSERAIDNWHARGGVQDPSEVRFHDLSDAVALVGLYSQPRAISGFSASAVELRRRDGTGGKFVLDGGFAYQGDTVGAEPAVMGATLAAWMAAAITAAAGVGLTLPPVPPTLLAALARVA